MSVMTPNPLIGRKLSHELDTGLSLARLRISIWLAVRGAALAPVVLLILQHLPVLGRTGPRLPVHEGGGQGDVGLAGLDPLVQDPRLLLESLDKARVGRLEPAGLRMELIAP